MEFKKYETGNETTNVRTPTELDEMLLGDFTDYMVGLLASKLRESKSIIRHIHNSKFTVVSSTYADGMLKLLDRTASTASLGINDWKSLVPIAEEGDTVIEEVSKDIVCDISIDSDLAPYGIVDEFQVLSERLNRRELYRMIKHVLWYAEEKGNSYE